jgi:hypothetical protein
MKENEYLYQVAQEECAEVAQRLSKCSRFTVDEIQPGQDLTNGERVMQEFVDLIAVVEMLADAGYLPNIPSPKILEWSDAKKAKVKKFMAYSRERGTLE